MIEGNHRERRAQNDIERFRSIESLMYEEVFEESD